MEGLGRPGLQVEAINLAVERGASEHPHGSVTGLGGPLSGDPARGENTATAGFDSRGGTGSIGDLQEGEESG